MARKQKNNEISAKRLALVEHLGHSHQSAARTPHTLSKRRCTCATHNPDLHMISTFKVSKIAPVLSALWSANPSAAVSNYVADVQYRAVLALCMPRLLRIHAHNTRVLGAHLLSFSEFNLVKLGQQLLDQGLVTQLHAQLAREDKTGAQGTAEQLLREYEASDTRGRVRIILDALVHLSRESENDTCHSALLSHALHWHEVALVIALTCQTATSAAPLSLPTLLRILVRHSALLDCHVLVLALNADHVRYADIVNALVNCHNVPQRESRARVKAALSALDRLEHACASEARDQWRHSHVIDALTRRLRATCHQDLSCAALTLDSTVTINGNGDIDHLFDVLLDICFHEDAAQSRDPAHVQYLAEHVTALLHHATLRAVLRRDQIDHVMTQLIVLLRRAEGATTQELHRLIRKVNEFSAEGSALVEDKSRDQSAGELANQQLRWRALMQRQARDGAELGALVNHVPQLFSSLNTLIRLVPQFTHVFNSPQHPLEISADFEAHVQQLFLDTDRAPHRTLHVLREMKRDLTDDQLLHVAPHVIGTLLPILVRADEARDHHVINTFVSIWKRVHSLDPEHVMQCTTRALIDDAQQLRTDPLRLFDLLPKMVVHPQLFSALFLEMIQYWRVVSERHVRVTGVKEEHVIALCQLQTSAIIQELLHACQHAALLLCDAGVKEQIATAVCRYVHQEFIEIPAMPKLVHFQGYDAALIPITTAGIPSMHVCLDFIPELLQTPSLEKQVFALQLAGHLIAKYPIQKSQHLASLVLQHIKQWHESANDTCRAYSSVIDTTLVLCCQSFPFLVESALELLHSLDTDTCHVLQSLVRKSVVTN